MTPTKVFSVDEAVRDGRRLVGAWRGRSRRLVTALKQRAEVELWEQLSRGQSPPGITACRVSSTSLKKVYKRCYRESSRLSVSTRLPPTQQNPNCNTTCSPSASSPASLPLSLALPLDDPAPSPPSAATSTPGSQLRRKATSSPPAGPFTSS